jgi:hypothetical protein
MVHHGVPVDKDVSQTDDLAEMGIRAAASGADLSS